MPVRCPACHCWRRRSDSACRGCAYYARRARERAAGRRCPDCWDLLPDDAGSRCEPCRVARIEPDRRRKKAIAAARFPPRVREQLAARLAAGEHLTDVCADLDVTQQRVHGWRYRDEAWAERLDEALMAGRDPELEHGTHGAYRHGRCRCPECREARNAPPVWWRQRTRA